MSETVYNFISNIIKKKTFLSHLLLLSITHLLSLTISTKCQGHSLGRNYLGNSENIVVWKVPKPETTVTYWNGKSIGERGQAGALEFYLYSKQNIQEHNDRL